MEGDLTRDIVKFESHLKDSVGLEKEQREI